MLNRVPQLRQLDLRLPPEFIIRRLGHRVGMRAEASVSRCRLARREAIDGSLTLVVGRHGCNDYTTAKC